MLLATALPAGDAVAQTPLTENTLTADEGAPPPAATLANAAWLEGHWVGTGLGAAAEEIWLAPAGGAMPGMFRLLDGDEVGFYELWALVEEDGTLVLRLKHFDAGMAGWEEKDEMVVFRLVDHDATTLWFDGLTMKRSGPDEMRVWVAMRSRDGTAGEGEFIYRRRES